MSARGKAFNEVKALLGRLDRSIDEARSKRLGDEPGEGGAAEDLVGGRSENAGSPGGGGSGVGSMGPGPGRGGEVLIGQGGGMGGGTGGPAGPSGAPGTWRPTDGRSDGRIGQGGTGVGGPGGARPVVPTPGVPLGPASAGRPRASQYGRAKPVGGSGGAAGGGSAGPVVPTTPGAKNPTGAWQPGPVKRLPDEDRLIG